MRRLWWMGQLLGWGLAIGAGAVSALAGDILAQPISLTNADESEEEDSSFAEPVAELDVDLTNQPDDEPEPKPAPKPARKPTRSIAPTTPSPTPYTPPRPSLRARLASVPHMFGDSLSPGLTILGCSVPNYYCQECYPGPGPASIFRPGEHQMPPGTRCVEVQLPLTGPLSRVRIGENDSPLPMDRIFFTYNYFHNAFGNVIQDPTLQNQSLSPQQLSGPSTFGQSSSLSRYTLGIEKRVFSGNSSVELRMPFLTTPTFNSPISDAGGGPIGNMSLVYKQVLLTRDHSIVSGGVAINLPTGDNVLGNVGTTQFHVSNDAVYISPYIAWLSRPTNDWFYQTFIQFDFPCNGNGVTVTDPAIGSQFLGRVNDQSLFYVDLLAGYWLIQNTTSMWQVTGLASIFELHYTTTMQDSDGLGSAVFVPGAVNQLSFFTGNNRMDVINLTSALHAQLTPTFSVRAGGVFPVTGNFDRFFDGEFILQVNKLY